MAMVAAAVANKGKLMKPQIWSRVVDPDGRTTEKLDPSEYSQPISAETAEQLTTAMEGVVREGTGTNAAIEGVLVAGKTGTAETPGNKSCGGGLEENQAWFIGFAPADDPQVASRRRSSATTAFAATSPPALPRSRRAILDGDELIRQLAEETGVLMDAQCGRRALRVLRRRQRGMADVWPRRTRIRARSR